MSLQPPEKVQKLQEVLHTKAKGAPSYRFYVLYDKLYRWDVLAFAYERCRANQGAAGAPVKHPMIEKKSPEPGGLSRQPGGGEHRNWPRTSRSLKSGLALRLASIPAAGTSSSAFESRICAPKALNPSVAPDRFPQTSATSIAPTFEANRHSSWMPGAETSQSSAK